MSLLAAGPERAAELAALHAQAFDKAWSADEIGALIDGAGAFALLSEDEGPQGMIMARRLFDEAEILTLAVAPTARRKGLGRALTLACAEMLRAQGVGQLFLEVGEDNPAAIALYETCGFVQAGRRRDYYDRGGRRVDALVMRLDLNSGRP
jgi:ribosomal-protein-alanine N-acetyltransferase